MSMFENPVRMSKVQCFLDFQSYPTRRAGLRSRRRVGKQRSCFCILSCLPILDNGLRIKEVAEGNLGEGSARPVAPYPLVMCPDRSVAKGECNVARKPKASAEFVCAIFRFNKG